MIEAYKIRGGKRLSRRRIKRELEDEVDVYSPEWDRAGGGIDIFSFGSRFYNSSLISARKDPSVLLMGCRDGIDLVIEQLERTGYSLKLIHK